MSSGTLQEQFWDFDLYIFKNNWDIFVKKKKNNNNNNNATKGPNKLKVAECRNQNITPPPPRYG